MEYLLFGAGALLRLYLINNQFFSNLADGVMFSTPLTAWKRVTEGCHLLEIGVSPYVGDVVHETPLVLLLFSQILQHCPACLPYFFILVDLLIAYIFQCTARHFLASQLAEQKRRRAEYHADSGALLLRPDQLRHLPTAVAIVYLFNPFTALCCAALSTAALHHLPLALTLYSAASGRWLACMVSLAVSCYLDLYSAALLTPLLTLLTDREHGRLACPLLFVTVLASLLLASARWTGDWSFLHATYGFTLLVSDLTPNVGLFWYFFTEMFQHFETLFIATFQINAVIYAVPLTLRFRDQPFLVLFSLLVLMATFRSYPSLADAGLYLALLPLWRHLAPFARYVFLVSCFYISVSVLAPVMWTLWIHAGSANANFVFAVTLAYNGAQIFLVTDLLFAHLKREYELHHGRGTEIDGRPAKLVLH